MHPASLQIFMPMSQSYFVKKILGKSNFKSVYLNSCLDRNALAAHRDVEYYLMYKKCCQRNLRQHLNSRSLSCIYSFTVLRLLQNLLGVNFRFEHSELYGENKFATYSRNKELTCSPFQIHTCLQHQISATTLQVEICKQGDEHVVPASRDEEKSAPIVVGNQENHNLLLFMQILSKCRVVPWKRQEQHHCPCCHVIAFVCLHTSPPFTQVVVKLVEHLPAEVVTFDWHANHQSCQKTNFRKSIKKVFAKPMCCWQFFHLHASP